MDAAPSRPRFTTDQATNPALPSGWMSLDGHRFAIACHALLEAELMLRGPDGTWIGKRYGGGAES
jgi:hypothetical protein